MFSALCFLSDSVAASASTPIPSGVWLWDDGRAAVEFHACGEALCARIVWVIQEAVQNAPPLLDTKNPDPALRNRRICGLDYITAVKRTKEGDWKNGRVYDFNDGSSYDLDIDTVEPAQVKMRGYKGFRMLGANLTLVVPKTTLPACKAQTGSETR
jgi:uncharacterized protein (DUF2147 family)